MAYKFIGWGYMPGGCANPRFSVVQDVRLRHLERLVKPSLARVLNKPMCKNIYAGISGQKPG